MGTVFVSVPPGWQLGNEKKKSWVASVAGDFRTKIQEEIGLPCILSTDFEDTARGRQNRGTAVRNSHLVVFFPIGGSWDGGVDYENARQKKIPTMVICSTRAHKEHHVPRVLLDDPNNRGVVTYSNRRNAVRKMCAALQKFKSQYGLRRRRKPTTNRQDMAAKRVKLEIHEFSRRGRAAKAHA